MDQLEEDQKKVEKALYQLDEDLRNGFQRLKELNEENDKEMQNEIFRMQQKNDDQERRFRQTIQDTQKEFTHVFQKEIRRVDDEREELHKKRGEIPWD